MKTLDSIKKNLELFENNFGLPVSQSIQGSEAWFKLKLGVISASNASKVVAKRDSETRNTYMAELVAQVATGIMEEINSKYIEWGKLQEDAARSCYEFMTGSKIVEVPFVFKNEKFREGCSPDGLVDGKGVEIKCPYNTVHHIKTVVDDKIKPEYVWQYQYTLRVMEADEWDFISYDPRMKKTPMKIITVTKDEEKQQIMEDLVPLFIDDMDKMLSRLGITFGEQWTRLSIENEKAG